MKRDDDVSAIGCFFLLFAAPFSFVVRGWVLGTLWAWFIVPVFHLPALRIPYAIGLSLLVGMLTHQTSDCEEKKRTTSEHLWRVLAVSFVGPLMILGIGWLVRLFV